MPKQPLVSIVTPTFNQADYLAQTLDSVLSQSYPNIEFIVLDDGSTDATPEILARYDGTLQHSRHSNRGQALTLNKGWSLCRGDYIGYLSSDDILYPDAIAKLVEKLVADDGIVCIFPDGDLIDSHSRVVKKHIARPFDLAELVIRQECYIGPGALFRRDAYERVGGWLPDLKLAPDREFWMRLAAHGRFEFLPEILTGYRFHPASISYKDVSEPVGREYIRVLDNYFSSAAVPSGIVSRKSEAYGHAHLVLARNAFRSGDFNRGWTLYREACRLHRPLSAFSVKARLVRNVISKPVRRMIAAVSSLTKRGH